MAKQNVICSQCGTEREMVRRNDTSANAPFWCEVCRKAVKPLLPPLDHHHDPSTNELELEKLKVGDIVVNGWASPGINDLHIVVGSATKRTSKYSTRQYYKTRMCFRGKLDVPTSLFDKKENKLTKIGHYDFNKAIVKEMLAAYEQLEQQTNLDEKVQVEVQVTKDTISAENNAKKILLTKEES